MQSVLVVANSERTVLYREQAAGMYSPLMYVSAAALVSRGGGAMGECQRGPHLPGLALPARLCLPIKCTHHPIHSHLFRRWSCPGWRCKSARPRSPLARLPPCMLGHPQVCTLTSLFAAAGGAAVGGAAGLPVPAHHLLHGRLQARGRRILLHAHGGWGSEGGGTQPCFSRPTARPAASHVCRLPLPPCGRTPPRPGAAPAAGGLRPRRLYMLAFPAVPLLARSPQVFYLAMLIYTFFGQMCLYLSPNIMVGVLTRRPCGRGGVAPAPRSPHMPGVAAAQRRERWRASSPAVCALASCAGRPSHVRHSGWLLRRVQR